MKSLPTKNNRHQSENLLKSNKNPILGQRRVNVSFVHDKTHVSSQNDSSLTFVGFDLSCKKQLLIQPKQML